MPVSVTHQIQEAQLTVTPVVNRADMRRFVEMPYAHYAREPRWVPPLRRDEYRRLSPQHNPFFEHAEMQLWLAMRGGHVVGRVAAIDDRLHNDTHHERVTWFGFFEASGSDESQALLQSVEAHAARVGSHVVRGPANPSLNDSVGLLIDAFDQAPYILMPWNPPSYPSLVEDAGYTKCKDLLAWAIDTTVPLDERMRRVGERLRARHRITVRSVRMSTLGFEQDLAHLKAIYRSAWSDNWGFVPPTDAEIRHLATELKPVLDPELALFAEVQGQVAGCALALPDLNQVLARMHGRILPFGLFHFLRRRSIITRARVLLLGVLPEYRRLGIYQLLIAELHRRGQACGYTRGELSWTLEDNHLVNAGIEAAGGRRDKTYRLYEKPVR